MDRSEFKRLFDRGLETAASNVEGSYSVKLPRNFQIELHGIGHSGDIMDTEEAVEWMYIGQDSIYPIIDMGVAKVTPATTTVRVMVSGHVPVSGIEHTWNNPPGNGPFKQIIFGKIDFVSG